MFRIVMDLSKRMTRTKYTYVVSSIKLHGSRLEKKVIEVNCKNTAERVDRIGFGFPRKRNYVLTPESIWDELHTLLKGFHVVLQGFKHCFRTWTRKGPLACEAPEHTKEQGLNVCDPCMLHNEP